MNLTVCCVLVDGPVSGYTAEYVVRLERMARRHLDRPFRFVCLTDGTRGKVPYDTIPIRSLGRQVPANGRGYWAKLQLFNPAIGLTGRCLFLDLDVLVIADLAPIADYPAQLALTEDALCLERAHLDKDRFGRRVVRRFNSSVIVWDAGTHDDLFETFSARDYHIYSTDQDWIGLMAPDAKGMPVAWFPRISKVQPPWPAEAKVILAKKPKPHDAVQRWPWFREWWG